MIKVVALTIDLKTTFVRKVANHKTDDAAAHQPCCGTHSHAWRTKFRTQRNTNLRTCGRKGGRTTGSPHNTNTCSRRKNCPWV